MAFLVRRASANSPITDSYTLQLPFTQFGNSTVNFGGATRLDSDASKYFDFANTGSQYVKSYSDGGQRYIAPQGDAFSYTVGSTGPKRSDVYFGRQFDFQGQRDIESGRVQTSFTRLHTDGAATQSFGLKTLSALQLRPAQWSDFISPTIGPKTSYSGPSDKVLYNSAMSAGISADAYHQYNSGRVGGHFGTQTAQTASINRGFANAMGGASYDNGPFSNTRYNMLGGMETITRSDPRHTSNAYADMWNGLYNSYQSGSITGGELFRGAMSDATTYDHDWINNNLFNFSAAPTVKFNFNSRGGGSISGTGISFR